MDTSTRLRTCVATLATLVAVMLVTCGAAWGTTLLEENFSYVAGTTLQGQGGWIQTGTTASPDILIASSGLTYPGYASSGIGNAAALGPTGDDNNDPFTTQSSGNVYIAFLVNVSATKTTGDYFLHTGAAGFSSGNYGRIYAKTAGTGTFFLGLSFQNDAVQYTTTAYNLGTTYLLVLKYTINPGTNNDQAALFVSPPIGPPEPPANLTASYATASDPASIGSVALRQGSNTNAPAEWVDGIRVATTWEEAVTSGGAPTPPSGVGLATPASVPAPGTTLLTVTVTPGTLPPSTGLTVAADLSAIGGVAGQSFFDDATNGDVTAGDDVFSYLASVSAATGGGPKVLPATIADAQGRNGACDISLTVVVPTPPSGVGAASPASVYAGGSSLLTVTVTPGTLPPSTGLVVSADLSAIGGVVGQSFFDDATHGDVTAGDDVFSYSATVPPGSPVGARLLPFTIGDAEGRSGGGDIALGVVEPSMLVISQVYGGGGNAGAPYLNDFVELFNRGATPIDVTGYSVQYTSATGTSWGSQKVVLASGSIPPGGYFLVQLGSGGSAGAALPTPDATATFNMSATAGKVALVSNGTSLPAVTCPAEASIVDLVGYGTTANCSEGSSPALAPSNTTADLRLDAGCTDTNVNSADFEVLPPAPRNSASPAHSCVTVHAPTLSVVEWAMLNSSEVRFHLRWTNPEQTPSQPTSGTLHSQEFGAFLPDYGPIGAFDVPVIEPESFFDVFFDVPVSALPPAPAKKLPNGGPPLGWPCPRDTVWAGNVDVLWDSLGIMVHVNKHFGNLLVNPGMGASLIHVVTNCATPAPWAIAGLCPGFNATLVNEDKVTPAPNPLPPNWTGYILVSSPAATPAGQVCCFNVILTCNGVPGVIQLCATTCIWPGPHAPTLETVEWSMLNSSEVRFHLRWTNPEQTPSQPTSGTLHSQEFGAFLPDFGPIGAFDVPVIEPESFFDVFFDVPVSALPPAPAKTLPNGGPPLGWPCPRDTVWAGNVDVLWDSLGTPAIVLWHWTQVLVNPGVGASLIHVVTNCATPAPWAIVGLCPGFNATLVNEDKVTPAPNPLPPNWTGYILVSSPAGTAGGLVCCFNVVLTCNGVPGVLRVCATTCIWPGPHAPTLETVEWAMLNSSEVRFHLHWTNPDPETPSQPTSGTLSSQEFGAFLPDFGTIGAFNVPAIMPESFFDVFFDVPLAQLPPAPVKTLPNGGPPLGWPCPRDTVWAGNVDVVWDSLGVPINVWRHFGNLLVNPGMGASLIHVVTNCAVPAPWAIVGLCPGFNATLVNEDLSPAANPLPAGWTGFISVTAAAATPAGQVCCFNVVLTCNGVPGVIRVCAITCVWPTAGVPGEERKADFGIRTIAPNPTAGTTTITFGLPRSTQVHMSVIDVSGKRVRMLIAGERPAGIQTFVWDGRAESGAPLPAGVYFLTLKAEGRTANRTLVLLR